MEGYQVIISQKMLSGAAAETASFSLAAAGQRGEKEMIPDNLRGQIQKFTNHHLSQAV